MSSTTKMQGGIGFSSALFLLFLGLRLTGHVDWAWYWVASPLLAIPALAAVFAGLLYGVTGLLHGIDSISNGIKRRQRFNKAGKAAQAKLNNDV